MKNLIELADVRQVAGEPRRRWFASSDLDLVVWCDTAGVPIGFQLCYDKGVSEHALMWKAETGFLHTAVDDGESDVGLRHKSAPVLVADGLFDLRRLRAIFTESSAQLPTEIVAFVIAKLGNIPDPSDPA